jgi:hypothetical protein
MNGWKNTKHRPRITRNITGEEVPQSEGNWSKQDTISTYQHAQMVHEQIADHVAWQQLMFGGDQFLTAN